jgi:hypothetical protein
MPALLVDVPDDVRERRIRQDLRKKHKNSIRYAWNRDCLSPHRFVKSNSRGGFSSHPGILVFFSDARSRSELGLRDTRAEHGYRDARFRKLIPNRR